jgi:hypothetical protein
MADEKPEAKKPAGKTEEDILTLARKRFKAAEEAEGDNRTKEVDDLKFAAASPDDHFQWPENIFNTRTDATQEGGARPCLTINPLPTHIRQVTNEQRMNRQQIKVKPVDDKGDTEVADVYNGVIRHIQVASEADLATDLACDAQVTIGEGFFRILTEYCDERSFDQDIVIAPIADRFKVYLDPIGLLQHPAGKKCQWGFIIEDLPKEEYEELHGDEYPVDWAEAGVGDQVDWFPSKDTVRIAEYLEIEQKPAKLYQWANGSISIEGEPMPEGVFRGELPKKTRKTRIPKCIWRKITGQAVLSTKEMPTKYLPIIRVVGNQYIIEGKPLVSGIVRNSKDAVRTYNYNASMEVEMNALAPKAPFIGYAEQFEGHEDQWRRANQVSYAFLKANMIYDEATGAPVPMPLPQRAQPAMPQAAIISAKLAAADDIKKTTGQFDPSLGNNPQSKSGVALQREQIKSDVGTFHYVDNLARALRYAGTIIVDMIPKVYSGKRIARILGEDGEPDHVMLDDSIQGPTQDVYNVGEAAPSKAIGKIYNLGVGKYDVVVNTGPSFTTKRQEASEFLTHAIQRGEGPGDGAGADLPRAEVERLGGRRRGDRDGEEAPAEGLGAGGGWGGAADPARGPAGDGAGEARGRAAHRPARGGEASSRRARPDDEGPAGAAQGQEHRRLREDVRGRQESHVRGREGARRRDDREGKRGHGRRGAAREHRPRRRRRGSGQDVGRDGPENRRARREHAGDRRAPAELRNRAGAARRPRELPGGDRGRALRRGPPDRARSLQPREHREAGLHAAEGRSGLRAAAHRRGEQTLRAAVPVRTPEHGRGAGAHRASRIRAGRPEGEGGAKRRCKAPVVPLGDPPTGTVIPP